MTRSSEPILTCDLGGTHIRIAIIFHSEGDRFELRNHETHDSVKVKDFPKLLRDFMRRQQGTLPSRVRKACVGFAGPVSDRSKAFVTNLGWGFEAAAVEKTTGISGVILLNDFEAVGYGLETLIANRPEAFVRLSRRGTLPRNSKKPIAVVLGAGTGLGTSILAQDPISLRYRPIPGEGGHSDFIPLEEIEFRIAGWIRANLNQSPNMPVDCEKIVSGPGLVNVYRALSEIQPEKGQERVLGAVMRKEPFERPAVIVRHVDRDRLCRKALDIWIRCYARAAKNCAIFPLAPGGVFLAGGIAAKILPELQKGAFMREFHRCDVENIRTLLEKTAVYVITDHRIALYGCANVAANSLV